jgi:hypothetical protein
MIGIGVRPVNSLVDSLEGYPAYEYFALYYAMLGGLKRCNVGS